MRNWTIILFAAFLTLSSQTVDRSNDFSSPKALVETFVKAANDSDKDVLSNCFSDRSPGEWDKIRSKSISSDDLEDIRNFVSGAEITRVEMKGDNEAVVFVAFKSRNEQIYTIREDGRWFILDF